MKKRTTPVEFVAEADLPTDLGHFRMRAYRVVEEESGGGEGGGVGDLTPRRGVPLEPIVIYSPSSAWPRRGQVATDKGDVELLFADKNDDDEVVTLSGDKMAEAVPVRIHDQCLTSEVFRSQRYDSA